MAEGGYSPRPLISLTAIIGYGWVDVADGCGSDGWDWFYFLGMVITHVVGSDQVE
jgi:hypothetical protein